jgi:Domain of unknown function (DUF4276)
MIRFGFVVEGEGEVEAVPLLVRRIIGELDPAAGVSYLRPVRVTKSRVVRQSELERAIELVRLGISGAGAILVILDADQDCPADLGPRLMARAVPAARGCPVSVVIAKAEYECWFLAAAASLGGKRRLVEDIRTPADPESVRGAKEWLTHHMLPGNIYSPAIDQPKLTGAMDLAAARISPSFARCYREVERLYRAALAADVH